MSDTTQGAAADAGQTIQKGINQVCEAQAQLVTCIRENRFPRYWSPSASAICSAKSSEAVYTAAVSSLAARKAIFLLASISIVIRRGKRTPFEG